MKTLKSIANSNDKTVYVYAKDAETARRFLLDAENEGFVWSDGSRPTQKHISDLFAVHSDFTVNYVGMCGRIAFGSGSSSIERIDYNKYYSDI